MSSNPNNIDKARQIFKEAFVDTANELNNDPFAGEILGILMFEDRPLSIEKIAEKTGYSKSHINNKIRELRDKKFLKEKRKPGSRKNYYEIENIDQWTKSVTQNILNHSESIIQSTDKSIKELNDQNKIDLLKNIRKKHKTIYKSIKLLSSLKEEQLQELFEKHNIEEPNTK